MHPTAFSSVPIHFFVVTNIESGPLVERVMEQVRKPGLQLEKWHFQAIIFFLRSNTFRIDLTLQVNYTSNCNFDFSILSFDKIIEETQVEI